jgi:hypothetical protein
MTTIAPGHDVHVGPRCDVAHGHMNGANGDTANDVATCRVTPPRSRRPILRFSMGPSGKMVNSGGLANEKDLYG